MSADGPGDVAGDPRRPLGPVPSPVAITGAPALGRLVLVDSAVAMRDALAMRLSRGSIQVVGTAATTVQAMTTIRTARPDLVICDSRLDDATSVELLERLETLEARPRVLLYTSDRDLLTLHRALRAGAHGYALKSADVEELRWAIEYVLAGNPYIDPRLEPLLGGRAFLAGGVLAPREREVLALIAAGLATADIAAHLQVGEQTVRTHVERARRKLGARNRAHAVALAVERGLISVAGGTATAA